MTDNLSNIVFIQRYCRPTWITYKDDHWVFEGKKIISIEESLPELLSGYIFLTRRPAEFDSRGSYGSMSNHFQHGKSTYHVSIILPEEIRKQQIDVILESQTAMGTKRISLSEIPLPEVDIFAEYRSIWIPEHSEKELTAYSVIYGGPTDSEEPLQLLHLGQKARDIFDQINVREGHEGFPSQFRK